jgi:hypothetical protein
MLRNKVMMKAYLDYINSSVPTAKDLNLPEGTKNIPQKNTVEDIKSELLNSEMTIPDSVFNSFNNGYDEFDEANTLKERFNFDRFDNER